MERHTYKGFNHINSLPKVSCNCITYGRTSVLDELVYSFLIQDYPGEKELIILNDYDELELIGDFPNVTIYNEKQRYSSIGLKNNECIERCSGEIIMIWDDDDISLSNRISQTVMGIKNSPFFKPDTTYFYSQEGIKLNKRIITCCAAYTKEAWREVGGFPDMNAGLDQAFEQRLKDKGLYMEQTIPDDEASFIYRWFVSGEGTYHTSVYGWGNGLEEAAKHAKEHNIKGTYHITPQWREDYIALTREALARYKQT